MQLFLGRYATLPSRYAIYKVDVELRTYSDMAQCRLMITAYVTNDGTATEQSHVATSAAAQTIATAAA